MESAAGHEVANRGRLLGAMKMTNAGASAPASDRAAVTLSQCPMK
jgi:hypothetical protein